MDELQRQLSADAPNALLNEAIDVFCAYLDSTRDWALKTADVVQKGPNKEAEHSLAILTAKLGRLIRLFSLMRKSYGEINAHICGNQEIKAVEVHLLSVLKAVKNAQVASDQLMLADLIEHELQDNLTQWKIKVAAQLKQTAQPHRR